MFVEKTNVVNILFCNSSTGQNSKQRVSRISGADGRGKNVEIGTGNKQDRRKNRPTKHTYSRLLLLFLLDYSYKSFVKLRNNVDITY